jgi:hypothetical protein
MTLPDATDLDAVEEIRTAPRGSGCRQIWRAERGLGGVVQHRGIRPPVWRRRRRSRASSTIDGGDVRGSGGVLGRVGGGRLRCGWSCPRATWGQRCLEVAAAEVAAYGGGGGVWRWAGGGTGTAATAMVASEGGVIRVIFCFFF